MMAILTNNSTKPVLPYTTDNPPTLAQLSSAQVFVGSVIPDTDNAAKYITASQPGPIFSDYVITSRYERDPHTYMLGITSTTGFQGASAAFVQLAAPTVLWIVDWTASKLGSCPTLPSPTSQNPRWVYLGELGEPAMVVLVGPDGVTPVYRMSGTYVYGCANPSPSLHQDMVFPQAPWIQQGAFDRTIPTSVYDGTLISPVGFGAKLPGS